MANKTILNADLYDNVLTEKPGDYSAKPRITGTARNRDVAARIVRERTEYRLETIENILNLADQKKIELIAEGKSLVDGVGQYLLNISGSFEGESPTFDPMKHKVGITYTPGKDLLSAMDNITFNVTLATTGPVINTVTEVETRSVNQYIYPGDSIIISGSNLLIKGDDPSIGLFFTKDEADAKPVKATIISRNTISEIIAQVPKNLDTGQYRLSITTQAGAKYKTVKEPRTYLFPILLTIKSNSI